jgi:hypothetical protein
MEMYDNSNTLEKSFDVNFIPEESLQAQWAEMIELKKAITRLYKQKGKPLSVLDIGIGNARIPRHLCGIPEIWNMIGQYDGTDNVQTCVEISGKTFVAFNIAHKATAYLFEATRLSEWHKQYDLIITTWFTAGNFYPDNFSFETYRKSGELLDLTHNPKFHTVFLAAYRLLNPAGKL